MGDFDRNAAPKAKNQTRQVAIAITLAVVFIGVLGYHFIKQGPQTASAADGSGGGAPMAFGADDTPENLGERLMQDPSAHLLRGATTVDPKLAKVPPNPFVMDSNWRREITAVVEGPVQVNLPPVNSDVPQPKRVPLGVNTAGFKLASIVGQSGKYTAILNGQVVNAGMVIDGARIMEIRADRVILQNADFRDGPKSEVLLSAKLNN